MSTVKCRGGVFNFIVNTGVKQECVLAPSLFNTFKDCVLGRAVDKSHCRAFFGNIAIAGLVFADDTVIFAESLGALHEESNPLRPRSILMCLEAY